MPSVEEELYITPVLTPICALDATEAFAGLTADEKKYSHFLSIGSWAGSLACLVQTSPESPKLFALLQELFTADEPEQLREKAAAAGVGDSEFAAFMQFVACFYGNMGNYLSFGDTKFVPRCAKASVSSIIGCSSVPTLAAAWESIAGAVYDLSADNKQMGLEGAGISTYYSPGISKASIQLVQDFLASQDLGDQAYNTRLFEADGELELAIASADVKPPATHEFKGAKIKVTYGDHQPFMARLADSIAAALPHCPPDRPEQREMLEHYVAAFRGGSIEDHKRSQRAWINDIAPPVETNIGFIESYRDPFGTRGEFEGFVAVVNREQSRKFGALVDRAADFIRLLPWDPHFEKDEFTRPDFTSLDVVSFASSGIPAGINIPNYDDIRGQLGFKNVSLGNVLGASSASEKVTFLSAADEELFRAWRGRSFEVQVAIHELLGHGSGKLLREKPDGTLNFDPALVSHPFEPGPVQSYYKVGETWDSKFGAVSSSYEECRAECAGIYLSLVPEILAIFGHTATADEVSDVSYGNWLIMVRAGLLALEFYSPDTKSWRQAHMQARYVIFRVLMEAGEGLLTLSGGGDGTIITLDRAKILSTGRRAIGAFLEKLNVYKATADVAAGVSMYSRYSEVPADMMPLRDVVLAQKQPRKLFVQANTVAGADGHVSLRTYEPTPEGMVRSFVDRFGRAGPLGDLVPHLARCGPFRFPAAE